MRACRKAFTSLSLLRDSAPRTPSVRWHPVTSRLTRNPPLCAWVVRSPGSPGLFFSVTAHSPRLRLFLVSLAALRTGCAAAFGPTLAPSRNTHGHNGTMNAWFLVFARSASTCISSLVLICASGGAAGQSLGDMIGRIGEAGLGIGEASVLQASRAPDGPFRKDASDYNPELEEELAKLLPPGTDLRLAATGFRNLGEFVTAVRVSSNLAIPFNELKARIVARKELSDAIVSLRPDVDGLIEARRARQMARDDLS